MGKDLRLYGIKGDNFLGLEFVELNFDGKPVVEVTGTNGAGKSSLLKLIGAVLGGAAYTPDDPIRHGADSGGGTIDLGDLIVTKRWTDKGVVLTAKSPDGMKYTAPQKLLSELIGRLSFDPLAFSRAKPADQVETLKSLVGLDFRILDQQRKTHYDNRTVVNKEVDGLRGQLEAMAIVVAPDEPVNVAELLKEQAAAIEEQRRYDGLKNAADEAVRARGRADARVVSAKEALAKAQKELADAEAAAVKAQEREEEAAGEYDVAVKPELDAIREQLAKAQETNELVRQKKARAVAGQKLRAKEQEAADLTAQIAEIDKNKRDALASAQFPIPGLSFVEDQEKKTSGVTFNGVLFDQVNAANQLRISMAVGLGLNPRLKLMTIQDGSLLDAGSMKLLAELAAEFGAQVIVERVWREGETGILIRNGLVVDTKAA